MRVFNKRLQVAGGEEKATERVMNKPGFLWTRGDAEVLALGSHRVLGDVLSEAVPVGCTMLFKAVRGAEFGVV